MRRIRGYIYLGLLHGMDERYAAGMEAYAAIRIGPGGTVLQVPLYMQPDSGELRPYLMMAPRVEIDLQKIVVVR